MKKARSTSKQRFKNAGRNPTRTTTPETQSDGYVVEGSYVPKLAELGVLCMPASFVTYQRPQGLMQDCLRHWAESQYWCQKWDVNHSWLGPVLSLGLLSLDVSNFPGLSGGGGTERRTVATCWFSRVRVGVSNRRWGPLAGPQCSVRSRWDRGVPVKVGEVAVSLQGRGAAG